MINDRIVQGSDAFAGYYETARSELMDLLDLAGPLRILEVGCGGGANLALLKQRWPDAGTVGIELSPDAAQAARAAGRVDEVLELDVLDEACRFEPESFDVVILSHVLEHFARPDQVLAKVCTWLRRGGRVLVALPNVRHISVLVPLLLRGDFSYADSGILDRTHLRFYTRSSALRLLEEEGLQLLKIAPEFGGNKSRWLNRLSLGMASDFAAYAYNMLGCKR
ncbi:MAG: class I SAM-dependent methyltransferase [Rubrivivax sp.]|nr:MAG: class I SAM-dependent methyltransferase [Rubrivivax sp.]